MGSHNICLYKDVDKKYTDCNLKTTKFLDRTLIEVCAVIRSNTVFQRVVFAWRFILKSKVANLYHDLRQNSTEISRNSHKITDHSLSMVPRGSKQTMTDSTLAIDQTKATELAPLPQQGGHNATVLSTSLGKTFFAWRFISNANILFWLAISYQKPFVFSVSVFCSQICTLKPDLRQKNWSDLYNFCSKVMFWIFCLRK